MPKRNGNEKKRGNKRELGVSRDRPLPSTLPTDLKPYDTNNDGVFSKEERSAMRIAKNKERIQKSIDERKAEMKRGNRRPDVKKKLRRP